MNEDVNLRSCAADVAQAIGHLTAQQGGPLFKQIKTDGEAVTPQFGAEEIARIIEAAKKSGLIIHTSASDVREQASNLSYLEKIGIALFLTSTLALVIGWWVGLLAWGLDRLLFYA